MSVIEAPVTTEQVVITIEASPEQLAIQQMIELVADGHWCRDTTNDGHGRHCALGLISRAGRSDRIIDQLHDLVERAIPRSWLNDPQNIDDARHVRMRNGGTFRGFEGPSQRIASYNNTIENRQGIIDWFERAKLLA